ncbi:MAG: sigma-70 family RNA polymerase sigma factor [Schwartzia sp.]|nr:sigma-70 family RNA polymerase sigma factor [Schwartzia sp. (in: firmicutes)]
MHELNKIKLLTPEREAVLWKEFKERDDSSARKELIQSYQPLVFKQALAYRSMDVIMDILQEGTVGLIEAVESYDPSRGVAFSLFAVHRIRGRMINFLKREGRSDLACIDGAVDKDGFSLKDQIVDPCASVQEQAETHELSARVKEALLRLPQKERLVLEEVYIGTTDVGTAAEQLNVSESHVYRLQKTGIRRIRGMMSRFMQHWK